VLLVLHNPANGFAVKTESIDHHAFELGYNLNGKVLQYPPHSVFLQAAQYVLQTEKDSFTTCSLHPHEKVQEIILERCFWHHAISQTSFQVRGMIA
jgi:hypothetical protein